eukprot:1181901-Prorocentrum_minimum.AAC.1
MAVAVAAIKALTYAIANSAASTMMELEKELKAAADSLRRCNRSSITLAAVNSPAPPVRFTCPMLNSPAPPVRFTVPMLNSPAPPVRFTVPLLNSPAPPARFRAASCSCAT